VREQLAELSGAPPVEWVSSLAQAAKPLGEGVECVLLDLDTSGASPLSSLRWVCGLARDAAVIVLTRLDDEQLGVRALAEGAQDYLVKGAGGGPLLARAIRYATERRRAERSMLELREVHLQAGEYARLERGLLPTPLIADPRVGVSIGYRPGRGGAVLGGDFLDAVERTDGSIRAVVGDVSGHSVEEAALGTSLRIAWRTLALAGSDGAELLRTLEQVLVHERHNEDFFSTLCMLAISPDRRQLEMRLAGHPLPIVVDRHGARLISGSTGPPLGLALRSDWPATEVELDAPWSVLLYTDGLIEAPVRSGRHRLGAEQLVRVVGELHAATAGGAGGGARPAHGVPERGDGQFVEQLIERVRGSVEELIDDVAALWLTVR